MTNAFGLLLQPFLIFLYWKTGHPAWLWIITTVSIILFFSMAIIFATSRIVVLSPQKLEEFRARYANSSILRNVGYFINLATIIALFIYVNSFNGVAQILSVILLLRARANLLNGST